MRQAGLFGRPDQRKRPADCGDPLGIISRVMDVEMLRPALMPACGAEVRMPCSL